MTTDFCREILTLQDDADHLRELLHDQLSSRLLYDDSPLAWLLLRREYAEQLAVVEQRLADLVRRESPQVLQPQP
jgi:hypothetical protein